MESQLGVVVKIAVIGWGSLIWDLRDLQISSGWHDDGPMLPVEFARFSSGDRLTLVVVDGMPDQPTLWALSSKASLEDAAADLQLREECEPHRIGSWPRINGGRAEARYDEVVRAWVNATGLDGARAERAESRESGGV